MKSKYFEIIPTQIKEIPAQLGVIACNITPPNPYTWDSDVDFHGDTEVEFDILDRKGYQAKWLENKLSSYDWEDLANEVLQYMEKESKPC